MLTDNQRRLLRKYRIHIKDDTIKKTDAENRQIREIIRAVTEALDIPCHDSAYSSESFCDWLERNEREKTIDRHAKRVLLKCHLKMVDNEKVVDDVLEALSAENL